MQLTDEQSAIVSSSPQSRIIVEAGPGTGKTEVVAARLAWLLGPNCGLWPSRILVLSFSRSAVKALIRRIRSIDSTEQRVVEDLRHLSVRTFDSWSFRQLRFLGHDPGELLRSSYEDNIQKLVAKFKQRDPEDILENSGLRLNRIKHVIVDEFQDLTGLRAELVFKLFSILSPPFTSSDQSKCGFTILGDPNQAIYDWMCREDHGQSEYITSQQLMEQIKHDYSQDLEILKLTKNYRSTELIDALVKKAANILQAPARPGADKFQELIEFTMENCPILDINDVAMKITESEISLARAILCRSNTEALEAGIALEKQLDSGNLTIEIRTGDLPPSLPSWVARIFFRFEGTQLTRSNFKNIYETLLSDGFKNLPCEGEWESAWRILLQFARQGKDETSISMDRLRERIVWRDSLPDDEGEKDSEVIITTIHKSKGLEYDLVHIIRSDDDGKEDHADMQIEEARVLFVAMSRAKAELGMLELDPSKSFYNKTFKNGERSRWYRWLKKGFQQLEMGLECDIDKNSFVSKTLFENDTGVKNYQKFLAENEAELVGRDLVLEKVKLPGDKLRFVYDIYLEESYKSQKLMGRTRQDLTFDLLDLKHKNQYLPQRIHGLKIKNIVTVIGKEIDSQIPAPWSISRLWLGISFHGIGRYKTYWNKR